MSIVGDLLYFVRINRYILVCFWTFVSIILIGTTFIYFTNSQNSKQSKNKLNETHQKSHKSENQEFKFFNFRPPPYSEKSFENPILLLSF